MRKMEPVPKCICITPDGNRRAWWALGWLWVLFGYKNAHDRGLYTCELIVRAALKAGVEFVVLWVASHSNMKREEEVPTFERYLAEKLALVESNAKKERVRFLLCGDIPTVLEELRQKAQKATEKYDQTVVVLYNYDAERENADAVRDLVKDLRHSNELSNAEWEALASDELAELVRQKTWTACVPDIDISIRTGVRRWPTFLGRAFGRPLPNTSDPLLPFRMRNTLLVYHLRLWPFFRERHLHAAFRAWAKVSPRLNCGK